MKIYSWNVNGIRAVSQKGYQEWFAATSPEILCLQETKAQPDQVAAELARRFGTSGLDEKAARPTPQDS